MTHAVNIKVVFCAIVPQMLPHGDPELYMMEVKELLRCEESIDSIILLETVEILEAT